jgi:hypothetical protein
MRNFVRHFHVSISSVRFLKAGLVVPILGIALAMGDPSASPASGAVTSNCATGTPPTAAYTITVCLEAPISGAALAGNVPVSVSASVVGTDPGVQRLEYTLDGNYLLTDFKSPFNFTLPTQHWVDGRHTLAFTAQLLDGFITPQASIVVTFKNKVTTPPVNHNTFTPSTGTKPAQGAPLVVAAVGDGAGGEVNENNVVSLISSWNPNLLLYLGDVYEEGSYSEFVNWYGSGSQLFATFRAITDPTVGNHEYLEANTASSYFYYWDNVPNYYSFTTGGWHFVSLNANNQFVPTLAGSPQYQWLAQDLAANTSPCTLVFFHQPLFNIGVEGSDDAMLPIWSLLVGSKVDLVLTGHDHDYQRWLPLDGSGQPDAANGVTQFVVGTGGHHIQTFVTSDPRMARGFDSTSQPLPWGALRLELTSTGASYHFVNTDGTELDSGSIACKRSGLPGSPPPTPQPTVGPGQHQKLFIPTVQK